MATLDSAQIQTVGEQDACNTHHKSRARPTLAARPCALIADILPRVRSSHWPSLVRRSCRTVVKCHHERESHIITREDTR